MKKIAILLSVVMMSISAMAQVVTVSQITLSSASQGDKILRVVAASQFSAGYDNGYDAIVGAGQDGGLYVILAGERYTKLAIDALPDNLPLGFGSVADTEYTLTFSNFSGASYTIYDRVANKTITVASNIQIDGVAADPANKYEFTIDASLKNTTINDRFVINFAPAQSLCFRNNILEINGHAGEALIVKDAATDTEIVNIPALGLFYTKDLSDKSGRLVVTLNSVDYQIDVNPIVTDL